MLLLIVYLFKSVHGIFTQSDSRSMSLNTRISSPLFQIDPFEFELSTLSGYIMVSWHFS